MFVVQLHVRRLEALRRAGIVKRLADEVWQVPNDLPRQAMKYDFSRNGGSIAEIRLRGSIEQQVRILAATWLDEQLIESGRGIADRGFGLEVRTALKERGEFLIGEGLAERREGRLLLTQNLLSTLRARELGRAGKAISEKTGLTYRPAKDGTVVSGMYQRNVDLVSGRFAMLVEGQAFSLVPLEANHRPISWKAYFGYSPRRERVLGAWAAARHTARLMPLRLKQGGAMPPVH